MQEPLRFWEKRNTVKHPKRLVNNSKVEFCFVHPLRSLYLDHRNTENNRRPLDVSGPVALNSQKHQGRRRWRQLFRRRVAAPLPGSCIAATGGETPMRETHEKHKLMRFQAAFEQLMLTAYAMHAVATELFGYLMLLFMATKFRTSLVYMQFRK